MHTSFTPKFSRGWAGTKSEKSQKTMQCCEVKWFLILVSLAMKKFYWKRPAGLKNIYLTKNLLCPTCAAPFMPLPQETATKKHTKRLLNFTAKTKTLSKK